MVLHLECSGFKMISLIVVLSSLPSLFPHFPSLSRPPLLPTSPFPHIFLVAELPLTLLLPYYPLLAILALCLPYFLALAIPLAEFLHPRY